VFALALGGGGSPKYGAFSQNCSTVYHAWFAPPFPETRRAFSLTWKGKYDNLTGVMCFSGFHYLIIRVISGRADGKGSG
jgi:hypothetical protein